MPINIVAEEDWGEETTMEEWVVVDHPVVDDPLFPDALATSGTGSETHSTTCSEQRQHTFISEPRYGGLGSGNTARPRFPRYSCKCSRNSP